MPVPPVRRRWPAVAVVLALALTAACGGDGDGDGEGAGTLELAPSTTVTTTPEDRALNDLLVAEVPLEGFVVADEIVGAGRLDLEAAARAEPDPDQERALLEETGFQRGTSRAWLNTDQDVAYVAIYDFADAEGAAAYLVASTDRLLAQGATTFEVAEVPGAVGYTTVEEAGGGRFTTHAVPFVRDDRWVLALVGSRIDSWSPDDAAALAAAQAERLG